MNLCFLKCLRPSLSLVISLIPCGLWRSKKAFGEGLMKLIIFSLKMKYFVKVSKTWIKVFLFNNSRWKKKKKKKKKKNHEKVMLCLYKGNVALSSCSILCTSYLNDIKKVFWMFIFKNFVKETKFVVPTTKLKGF